MHAPGLTRRRFLQGTGVMATAFLLPGAPRLARAATSNHALVALYLRGGADGLSLVAPAGDPDYYTLRPQIAVQPGTGLDLDGFHALHPALAGLMPLFDAGTLAILHAVGSPDPTRSHFDAQDFMERAAPGDPSITDGWLNRALAALAERDPWAGITLGPARALALSGAAPSLVMSSIEAFSLGGAASLGSTLETMYPASSSEALRLAAHEAFATLEAMAGLQPGNASIYPTGELGEALADAAALIRADIGVRAVAIDFGGWDHHTNSRGFLPSLATQLATGLARLRFDLGSQWRRTCVVVMTEFGRTAAQNGSFGTDHGHGGVMLVAGAGVRGGRVITRGGWPGLGPAALHEGRDLAVTTDFRDVFAELLHRHLGLPLAALPAVLPGHAVQAANFPGLFA